MAFEIFNREVAELNKIDNSHLAKMMINGSRGGTLGGLRPEQTVRYDIREDGTTTIKNI